MKTYILRDPEAVEPQNPARRDPALNALVNAICGPAAPPLPAPGGRVLYVGLDVHNDTIAVSLAPDDSTEVRRYGIIGGSHDDVLRLIKKLSAAHPGVTLKFCYEAGPRGYPLCRFIRSHGAQRSDPRPLQAWCLVRLRIIQEAQYLLPCASLTVQRCGGSSGVLKLKIEQLPTPSDRSHNCSRTKGDKNKQPAFHGGDALCGERKAERLPPATQGGA